MLTLRVSSHQENFCSLQLIFGLASTSQGYPRITFCVPNAVTKNCVSFCLPLTSRLAVTYSLIEPSWFLVPSTFIMAISFHKLRMRRLCSFAKTRSIKIPVAPESTRAIVSTFQPFICRVTGMCIVFRLYHTYEVLTIGAITAEMLSSLVKNPLQSHEGIADIQDLLYPRNFHR